MSNPNGPARRRRIAGESKPADELTDPKRRITPKPVKKASVAKESAKAAPARKAPVERPKAPSQAQTVVEEIDAASADTVVAKASKSKVIAAPKPVALTKNKTIRPEGHKPSLPPRSVLPWLVPLALVALGAVVFGALFGVKGIGDYREQRGINDSNDRATSAAGKAAETIFSFQYNALPKHDRDSKALMTPSFQKEFDKISPALTELAPQNKIVVQAQSRSAAALPCGDECSSKKASVLVFLDQARIVGNSKEPTVFANRIVVDMVKRNGAWLVDNIQAL